MQQSQKTQKLLKQAKKRNISTNDLMDEWGYINEPELQNRIYKKNNVSIAKKGILISFFGLIVIPLIIWKGGVVLDWILDILGIT